MIVVDASVAVKWFLAEEGTPEANALLRGTDKLVAPELARVEVTAAITRRYRTGDLPEPTVRQGCHDWADMIAEGIITLLPSERDQAEAIDLAIQLKHPFQDCLYLALALRLNAPLVTTDPIFIKRVAGMFPGVRKLRP